MKTRINVAAILVLALAFVLPSTAGAADLSVAQVKTLEESGIPVYPGSVYVTGDNDDAIVMWFQTKDAVDKIMDWYKNKLSGWSEMTTGKGTRVIYKGPGGIEAKDLSSRPYIFARITDEDSGSTDSEITVRIPR